MRNELQVVLMTAQELPKDELPALLGELEQVRCTALARLTSARVAPQESDELLGVPEASRRLGVSRDFLYRHARDFGFTRRMGRKLLFSASGIERHIKQHVHIDSKASRGYAHPVGISD